LNQQAGSYLYFVNDMSGNLMRIRTFDGTNDNGIFSVNDHVTANGRIWAMVENAPAGGIRAYFMADRNGTGAWELIGQVDDSSVWSAVPSAVYIGIRTTYQGQMDNFGGGILATQGAVPFGSASLVAPVPTLSKGQLVQVPPAVTNLVRVSPGQSMAPVIGPAVMNLVRPYPPSSAMRVTLPFGTATITRGAVTGSTTVPAFPPIPQPPPPPPPPPPDPRDTPALDGPWTYMMYEAMEPLTWADASLGNPMLNFFKAIAYNYHEPYEFAVDPGWQLALDVDEVPSWWLNWLAQFVGISLLDFQLLDSQTKRDTIKDAPGWHRGTREAMIKAAQSTLTGNKTVIVYERYDPSFGAVDRAYHITFITYQAETPNQNLTLAALIKAKPGGLQLSLLSRAGQIWQWLRDHYPPTTQRTWAQVKSEYADWEHARDVTYY